jgi:hypothetical protein
MKQQLSLSSTVWLTTLSLPMHIQQWRKSIWWNELKHSVSATSMWTASRNVLLEITKIPIPSLHGKKLTLITIPYCAIKYLLKENTCQYKNAIFIVKKKKMRDSRHAANPCFRPRVPASTERKVEIDKFEIVFTPLPTRISDFIFQEIKEINLL